MSIDEKIQTARALIAEAETRGHTALGLTRGLLGEIDEELAALRLAQTFSEREMAEWLGCRERQLREYRLKHRDVVKPIMVTRRPRYSTWHQLKAQEIFTGLEAEGGKR